MVPVMFGRSYDDNCNDILYSPLKVRIMHFFFGGRVGRCYEQRGVIVDSWDCGINRKNWMQTYGSLDLDAWKMYATKQCSKPVVDVYIGSRYPIDLYIFGIARIHMGESY